MAMNECDLKSYPWSFSLGPHLLVSPETSPLYATMKAKAESHLVGFGITFSWLVLFWLWPTSCEKHGDSSQPLPQRSIHSHYQTLAAVLTHSNESSSAIISEQMLQASLSDAMATASNCQTPQVKKKQVFRVPLQSPTSQIYGVWLTSTNPVRKLWN